MPSLTWELFNLLVLAGILCWMTVFWCRDFYENVIEGRPLYRRRIRKANEALEAIKLKRVLDKKGEHLKLTLENDLSSSREALNNCSVYKYFLQFLKPRYLIAMALVVLVLPWALYISVEFQILMKIFWPVFFVVVYFACKPRMRNFIFTCFFLMVLAFIYKG